VAIAVQSVLTIIFLLIGGNFRQLFTLALFAEWLSYMTACSALFVLRRHLANRERKYRLWGFPLAPALFIVAAAGLLYYTFISNLPFSAWGTLVILAGIPVYYMFALRRTV
jgi:APA family basic amino acid/polyamine antiporter